MRRLLLVAGLAGLLLVPAGCGGDDNSALCDSLGELQQSVEDVRALDLEEGVVDDLRQSADEITDDIDTVQEAAEEELGTELQALETAVRALIEEAEAAVAAGDLNEQTLVALGASVASVRTAYDALLAAAPDC